MIRLGLKHKVKFIKISGNKRSTSILNLLIKMDIVSGWAVGVHKNHPIYFVYFQNTKKTIQTLGTPTKKLFVKYKDLKRLNSFYKTPTIFLSTNAGIISITEALKKKIGGFLLFRII